MNSLDKMEDCDKLAEELHAAKAQIAMKDEALRSCGEYTPNGITYCDLFKIRNALYATSADVEAWLHERDAKVRAACKAELLESVSVLFRPHI